MKNNKNVARFMFGPGSVNQLSEVIAERRGDSDKPVVYLVDHYFEGKDLLPSFDLKGSDAVIYVDTTEEPKTPGINALRDALVNRGLGDPVAVVGIGGGATLDTCKAIANLLPNGGMAEDYQGWDLVPNPGVWKVAVPTLSGTGAEASRTCVMTNPANGLKLGMNSDHTVYDQLVLDPDLVKTVSRDQYFYTGMDTYLHCIESLEGSFRNAVGDSFSREVLNLCRDVFLSEDMMDSDGRANLMTASYLGGCAVGFSFVGLVHPFSAGLSVVLGVKHCIGNCMVMTAMEEFYPAAVEEFWRMAEKQKVEIPRGICNGLSDEDFDRLYDGTIIHEKPLANALGENFKSVLTRSKVREIFEKM